MYQTVTRDLRTFFDFLWFARGGLGRRDATSDDRAAYEWWRRRDERGPRLEDGSWHREVSTVNQFYLWAIDRTSAVPGDLRCGRCRQRSHTQGRAGT
ncbi:hypothetical protein ADL12_36475 [Streptomyces regalis]|uniref:Core-binding (CB) domain-containing protein n=1 Tax=Streptomyces regalis TaxID=68262 RepID=A0A101JD53_9ACTN|nr:hypothetical protein ADL12_36475 [Streptomyces regalis]